MLELLRRLIGRPSKPPLPPFNFARNRYKAKTKWPPTLRDLTERQQFRIERKFKRRLRLKSIKPQWQKWTKIVQWSMIGFVVVYGVFFHDYAKDPMNPRPGEKVFEGLRARMWDMYGGLWTHTTISRGDRPRRRREPEPDDGQESRLLAVEEEEAEAAAARVERQRAAAGEVLRRT